MKITITVEMDEESVEFIKTPFGKLSDKIDTLIRMFEKVDYVIDNPVEQAEELVEKDLAEIDLAEIDLAEIDLAEIDLPEIDLAEIDLAEKESIIEEPPEKSIAQRGVVKAAILQEVKKHKRGVTSEKLKKETGYTGKQISNNMFHLKKANLVKKTKSGRFVAV